ncbi:hypothetical protein LTR37_005652 [Vermiconidia calcicola]|uniref:Uncharacterized protein n=1 Tax=Vermiconidia calcicola TaxID=1690605 RepID=A0ACC3NIU0_9PEZI|nr:hypothetical protein LTR37_005652 [Vermiconidia calcicola]
MLLMFGDLKSHIAFSSIPQIQQKLPCTRRSALPVSTSPDPNSNTKLSFTNMVGSTILRRAATSRVEGSTGLIIGIVFAALIVLGLSGALVRYMHGRKQRRVLEERDVEKAATQPCNSYSQFENMKYQPQAAASRRLSGIKALPEIPRCSFSEWRSITVPVDADGAGKKTTLLPGSGQSSGDDAKPSESTTPAEQPQLDSSQPRFVRLPTGSAVLVLPGYMLDDAHYGSDT